MPKRAHRHGLLPMLAILLAAATASAGPMPDDLAAAVAAIGPVIDPPATAKLYAPLQAAEPYDGVTVTRDIAYGDAPRQILDLFVPQEQGQAARPVLIYVHGGGFVGGNKRGPGSPFYDNVMLWAVANGMIGVNTTYRLAPDHPWPAGAEDLAATVAWVRQNIAAQGGDPDRIYLMGHSAGAVHVASYAGHPEFHPPGGSGLAGAILVSGLYDMTAIPAGPPMTLYFGDNPADLAARSSLQGLAGSDLPLLVAAAELDPQLFVAQAAQLNAARCAASGCPMLVELPGHSHMSEVYAINTDDTALTDAIRAFVAGGE